MKFNQSSVVKNTTVNHEGAVAYTLSPEVELYTLACTTLIEDKFYTSKAEDLDRLRGLVKKCNPEFVAKLAVYVRLKMNLRSIPVVLAVELAKVHNGDNLVGRMIDKVIQRPDEITELLAYYATSNNRVDTKKLAKLSKQVKKAIARALLRFDAYALQKYNQKSDVSLKDALFLTHPKPKGSEQEELFKQLISDTLPTPYTWETELSEAGKSGKDKKETWESLIDSKKVGYMALLRNLRNILEAKVSLKHIMSVAAFLCTPEAVKNNKQLPFRYLAAYQAIEGSDNPDASLLLNALEKAAEQAASHFPGFEGQRVFIACDVSGSMEAPLSQKSTMKYYDIGLTLGMFLRNRCQSCITSVFAERFAIKNLPTMNILSNVSNLRKLIGDVGSSTNGFLAIKHLVDTNIPVDKVFIFTDCQLWNDYWHPGSLSIQEYWNQYKAKNPSSKLYIIDLAGYGNTPINTQTKDVYLVAGWSERLFDLLEALENKEKVVDMIKKEAI